MCKGTGNRRLADNGQIVNRVMKSQGKSEDQYILPPRQGLVSLQKVLAAERSHEVIAEYVRVIDCDGHDIDGVAVPWMLIPLGHASDVQRNRSIQCSSTMCSDRFAAELMVVVSAACAGVIGRCRTDTNCTEAEVCAWTLP